jgi:hypothetical protein
MKEGMGNMRSALPLLLIFQPVIINLQVYWELKISRCYT